MYKMQMTAQKVICILTLVVSAVVFLYSLGMMTDLYGNLYKADTIDAVNVLPALREKLQAEAAARGAGETEMAAIEARIEASQNYKDSYDLYYTAQPFNHKLLVAAICLVLSACLLLVTNTGSRRRYYVGNYVAVAVNVVMLIVVSVWAHGGIEAIKAEYALVDKEILEIALSIAAQEYAGTNFWFDVHYVVFGLALLMAVLLTLNVIWKLRLMQEEKKLIEEGKAVSE